MNEERLVDRQANMEVLSDMKHCLATAGVGSVPIMVEDAARFPLHVFRDMPLEPALSCLVVESYEGDRDPETDRFEGHGLARLRNGDMYVGSFRVGLMHGHGKYVWRDGTSFEGEFRSNEIEGRGRYSWPDGSYYEGDVSRGLREGQGTFTARGGWPRYTGDWKKGMRHGRGTLWYDSEGKKLYEGDWVENMRQGQGKITYASGNTYEGDWHKDNKNGYGVMHWHTLRERYTGEWVDDKQGGFGEHIWLEDKPAEGSLGIMKQMCNLYRGEWANGERHGQGVFLYSNGARYSGQWAHNQKDGFGVFVFDDGHVHEGPFVKDKMVDLVQPRGPRTDEAQKLQLYVDVVDILPCAAVDVNAEIRKLEKLSLQYNSDFKKIYKRYCTTTGDGAVPNCFTMSVKEFKRFCRDAKIISELVSVTTIDRILYKTRRHHYFQVQALYNRRLRTSARQRGDASETAAAAGLTSVGAKVPVYNQQQQEKLSREDFHSLLFREFFEALVRLAHHIYSNEAPELSLIQATKKLIVEKITPYLVVPVPVPDKTRQGSAAPPQPLPEPQSPLSDDEVSQLVQKYSDQQVRGLVSRRAFVRMIRDAGLLEGETQGTISFNDVVQVLRSVSNTFGRCYYLEDGGDMTELSSPLTNDEFNRALTQLVEEQLRKEKVKELSGNVGPPEATNATTAMSPKAMELRSCLLQLISRQ